MTKGYTKTTESYSSNKIHRQTTVSHQSSFSAIKRQASVKLRPTHISHTSIVNLSSSTAAKRQMDKTFILLSHLHDTRGITY